MQSQLPGSNNHDPLKGLPPVQPPSGKFLAQLFLVPLAIVLVAMGVIWSLTWMVGGSYTPEQFLADLRSRNLEVRWRRASDLAQVLRRDQSLAANPTFALEITEMLRDALRDNEKSERDYVEKLKKEAAARSTQEPSANDVQAGELPETLENERKFIEFLIGCMGNFSLPTGAPLLNEIALKTDGADKQEASLRRLRAIQALAALADNLKRYDQLPPERRAAIQAELEELSQNSTGTRRQTALTVREYLKARDAGTPTALGVDRTMEKCAADEDLDLRKSAALALTYWTGTPEENERMEAVLLKLAGGQDIPDNADRVRARELRYQATLALAHRGSPKLARCQGVLQEMLDEDELLKVFRIRAKGKDDPDTAMVGAVLMNALNGIQKHHEKMQAQKESFDYAPYLPAIEKLTEHGEAQIRTEAKKTELAVEAKAP